MLIYEVLTQDHKEVKKLLAQLVAMDENTANHERGDLISEIRDALIPHSRAEEAVLYNSLRALKASKKIAMHGYQEHLFAETLLRTLQVATKIDAGWKTLATELKAALESHIAEEETEIFSAARAQFTSQEAKVMAEVFLDMKPTIKKQGLVGTTGQMVANLLPQALVDSFRL